MNSNTFVNRVEIILYSSLISVMSGINQLRSQVQPKSAITIQPALSEETDPTELIVHFQGNPLLLFWKYIREAFLPLVLWVILGFAAGFLIGMIRTR